MKITRLSLFVIFFLSTTYFKSSSMNTVRDLDTATQWEQAGIDFLCLKQALQALKEKRFIAARKILTNLKKSPHPESQSIAQFLLDQLWPQLTHK